MKEASVTQQKLVETLRDMADKVESGACDEGSIQFGPWPEQMGRSYWDGLAPDVKGWYEPDTSGVDLPGRGSVNMRLTKNARALMGDVFAVRAVYRFGRDLGQGGTRMIGVLPPSE